ncbi:hypothetical protein APS67_000136 [Streptomyces sp. AVP053U2]|nr:hypothetical protein APS67_000136 [Streptomyces sp. AVP053U2]
MHRITVLGGGFAGLTAAITAAEAGAQVTLHEAHHTLGGRARTAEGPYRTNGGPTPSTTAARTAPGSGGRDLDLDLDLEQARDRTTGPAAT